jgi:regulator of sigma E protease
MTEVLQVAGSFLQRVIVPLLALGLCVFVHEFGHLLAALWRGLHVERFSIGFGKRLWGFRRNGVDYQVSALPFGGYVALPQLDPGEETETSEGVPLPTAPPHDRIITALAGPLANILTGFLIATVVWHIGVYRPAATECEVISVQPESPEYTAGLRPFDNIVGVNGDPFTKGWLEVQERILMSDGEVVLNVVRDGRELEIAYTPEPNPELEGLGLPFFDVRIPTQVEAIFADSPAELAGLQPGDHIVSVNGEPVPHSEWFQTRVAASQGEPLDLGVRRDGRLLTIAGVRARRASETADGPYLIGVRLGLPWSLVHPTPIEQFTHVIGQTRRTLALMFSRTSLVKPRHLTGPVGIVSQLGRSIEAGGIREGLWMLMLVSFGLAIANLLPIPVLDGGHILLALIEVGIRRRIPAKLAYRIQMGFAILLIGLMLYITAFDVRRLLPDRDNGETGSAGTAEQVEDEPPPAAP